MDRIPERFMERYQSLVGDSDAFSLSLTQPLPKAFRVNTIKSPPDYVMKRFADYGIPLASVSWYQDAFVCGSLDAGATLEYFLGQIYIQELTSMLPPLLMRRELEQACLVLDACAAPGSKATQIAALMENRNTLVANDIDYARIRALKFNLEKCGVLNALITNQDIRFFPKIMFDSIFVDAPCSAEGTCRKNPKALALWNEKRIRGHAGLQKTILLKCFDLLRPGGTLLYSTCTFAPEENEAVISHLLSRREARLEKISLDGLKSSPGITEWEGQSYHPDVSKTMRIWPHQNDSGGFFLAKVVK